MIGGHSIENEQINAVAVQLLRCSQFGAAESLLLDGLTCHSGDERLRANLLRLYLNTGRFGVALEMVCSLPAEPSTLQLSALCGQIALQGRHPELAYAFFSRSLQLAAGEPSLLLPWSECCIATGRLFQAEAVLLDLCRRFPDALEPALNLAICRSELGQMQDALGLYTALLGRAPGHPLVLLNLARLHHHLGDDDKAEFTLRQLPAEQLDCVENQLLLADVLYASGQQSKALAIWQCLCTNDPSEFRAVVPLLFSALERRDVGTIVTGVCAAAAVTEAANYPTRFWSLLADSPRSVQQHVGPSKWFAREQLVQQSQVLSNSDCILSSLRDWVLNHPTLLINRASKPTQGGSQTHELLADTSTLCVEFKKLLIPSLREYLQRHATHPALATLWPAFDIGKSVSHPAVQWSGWGVVMNSGGRQCRHTHPESIISGVLYLAVPDSMGSDNLDEGSLAFSAYGTEASLVDASSLLVHPKPGLLVLFPSFLPHETIPTLSNDPRICIAFNVF